MKIKTITADSDNKTEAYTLLVMLHTMALRACPGNVNHKKDEWQIKSTATYSDYFMTTVTNNIIDLIAVTRNGHHTYTMQQCEEQ